MVGTNISRGLPTIENLLFRFSAALKFAFCAVATAFAHTGVFGANHG